MSGGSDDQAGEPRKAETATGGAGGEAAKPDRISVDVGGARRPFMRGIIVHSLMARGVGFDEANRAANTVRERIRARGVVTKDQISEELVKILGTDPFLSDPNLPGPIDITIHGKGKGQPFSKGVLSQSLLAAAIDPTDAFDVAREIEIELVRRQIRDIDRRELRALAYQTLSRAIGSAAAERYLIWRRYEDPDRPVILLLGGAAGVGKTSLALEVAHRLGIARVLSTDSVRQIMRLMLSPEIAPAIHGSSYDAHTHFPADALWSDPVIEGFRAQTATVAVGVRASIDRAIAENASTVLDGVSIVPGMIDLDAYSELADVIFLVVATLDPEAYAARFARRAEHETQRSSHRYLSNLSAILRIQDHFLEMAERHGVPIVDNESFDRAVLLIIRHLTETLRKRADFDVSELL